MKHRIGLTVTDPNHPMVSKRKETIQKTVRVPGEDREKAINTAIAHYKRKGYKVHDHHYIGTVAEEIVHTRTGADGTKYHIKQNSPSDYSVHREVDGKLKHIDTYGSLQRAKSVLDNEVKEDVELDEAIKLGSKVMIHAPGKSYHGKTGQVGEIRNGAYKGAPKTYTVDHDSGSIQLDKKNIKMHKVNEESDVYAKSEENKRSADAAKKQGNMFDHHMHMADYHDNLSQWNAEKGRHAVADTHAAKSQQHHENAMKLKEENTRIWEAWSMGKRDPQKGIKVGQQVRSYDFPGMHDDHYIEGHVVGETPHSYHIRTNKVVRGGKEVPVPAHMSHVEAPKGKGMFSGAYGVHKIMAKQNSVAAQPQAAQGAARSFANVRGKR